jgi:hypothetical protein
VLGMSWLGKIRKLLAGAAVVEGGAALGTGDIVVVLDDGIRVIPYGSPSDGDVLTIDSSADTGWSIQPPAGGGGGGGAPTNASYLVLGNNATLTNERALALGTGLSATDGGANSTYTIDLDADLVAVAGLGGTGLAVRTAADTWTTRSIAVSGTGLSVTNPAGVAGNPTVTLDPAAVVTAGWKAPPRIEHTGRAVEWMAVSTANPGTNTRAFNSIASCSLHFEEQPSATYDAILPSTTSASAAGGTITLAIYALDPATNRPGALLWSSNTIAAGNVNVNHTVTFASDGTWAAAGAAYKDGSDRLVLTAGQAIWKGAWGSVSTQWRTITETTARNIGYVTPVTSSSKFLGVDFTGLVYPTWPDPAPTGVDQAAAGVIALPLRWV